MKRSILLLINLMFVYALSAQQYQTIKSGDITDLTVFEQRPINGGKWTTATILPGYESTILVNKGDTLHINVPYSISTITIEKDGYLDAIARLDILQLYNRGNIISPDNVVVLTTGIESIDKTVPFNLYSVEGNIYMHSDLDGNVSFYNMHGNLLYARRVNVGANVFNINVKDGIYFAVLTSGKTKYSHKLYISNYL